MVLRQLLRDQRSRIGEIKVGWMALFRIGLRPPRSSISAAGTASSSRVLGRADNMTELSKAALRAELEAALANYRGPVKQCPMAPPPEEELETLDDEDETDEDIVPRPR
jgi:hypothetical protein